MLQLVVPALFQTDDFLDLLGEAHLPSLDTVLARGRREPLACSSLEALLCQELGIARQQDWPIAPIIFAHAGGATRNDYWLRADPVHVRIERDRLILVEIPDLPPDEESMLCEALSAHFGETFSPQAIRSGTWLVRTVTTPNISTTPLSQAAGQHIDPLLPTGGDALPWRTLFNEVQMLLFNHPVNQARELRGEPIINSVWLWGGGCLPEPGVESRRTVLCNHADWRALAEYAGAETHILPNKWSQDIPEHALMILDEPHQCLRRGDYNGWLQAMRHFDSNWLEPLLASGRPFRIDDPLQGIALIWRSAYRWKFWRRAQKPAQQTFKVQQPSTDPGIDAFGNRY